MSGVTVKDLRDLLEQRSAMRPDYDPNPVYAAFDAMAEKAGGFEKLRILLEQYQYVGLAKLVRSDRYVVIVGKQNFDGAKLIEALKAVPE